jgi:hypothetical protein
MEDEEFELDEPQRPEAPFHIEIDLYDSGDYSRLLVVPCNESYVVVYSDEHLCTVVKTCEDPECWEQEDGHLDEELIEKIGIAISSYAP